VYFFRRSDQAPGHCQGTGFTEPALWRVSVAGGRPRPTDLRTTSLAISPDGRMVAYTSSRRCGRTIWVVVRDRKDGSTRRILLAHNVPTSNNPIETAQLSWAPDDRHLAIAVAPAVAINALYVVNARTADTLPATTIPSCGGRTDECLDPAFDHSGRLTFLKWRNQIGRIPERVIRWQPGRASRIFTLGRNQSAGGTASIAAGGADGAVLIEGGNRRHQIWRWSAGRMSLIRSSSRRMLVTDVVWL
jgi:dipeptidyl aminopeptidase/acylaminoacyl peptidase